MTSRADLFEKRISRHRGQVLCRLVSNRIKAGEKWETKRIQANHLAGTVLRPKEDRKPGLAILLDDESEAEIFQVRERLRERRFCQSVKIGIASGTGRIREKYRGIDRQLALVKHGRASHHFQDERRELALIALENSRETLKEENL